jgi:hypothetical protein
MMNSSMFGGMAAGLQNLLAGRPNAGFGEMLLAIGSGGLGGQMQGREGIRLGRQQDMRDKLLERQVAGEEAKAAQEQEKVAQIQGALADPNVPDEQKAILRWHLAGVDAGTINAMRPPKPTGMAADAAALGIDISTPEGQAQYQQFRQGLSRPPVTNINMPGALDPRDAPIDVVDLQRLTGPDGAPLPVGTTYRQAQELGAVSLDARQAQAEEQAASDAAAKRMAAKEATGNLVLQDIGRALELVEGGWAAGPVAGRAADVPFGQGTPAGQLNSLVQSIKANVGFDKLQSMREASPTGGALGQVSEREIDFLQSTMGNLDIRQPQEMLDANLKRISNMVMDSVHGTPEQIQSLVDQGAISAEEAAPLMQRHQLPFDEMGRPVTEQASTAQQSAEQRLSQYGVPPVAERVPGQRYDINGRSLLWDGQEWRE